MNITFKSSKKELILGELDNQKVSNLVEISDDLCKLNSLMNDCFASSVELTNLNRNVKDLINKVNENTTDKLFGKQLLSSLAEISDGLHNLNCDMYNYFLRNGEDVPNDLIKNIEALIDKVDYIYVDGMVSPLCKRAVLDGFTYEEFEEKFDELCKECDITNPQSLIDCALDVFYDSSEFYKAM